MRYRKGTRGWRGSLNQVIEVPADGILATIFPDVAAAERAARWVDVIRELKMRELCSEIGVATHRDAALWLAGHFVPGFRVADKSVAKRASGIVGRQIQTYREIEAAIDMNGLRGKPRAVEAGIKILSTMDVTRYGGHKAALARKDFFAGRALVSPAKGAIE